MGVVLFQPAALGDLHQNHPDTVDDFFRLSIRYLQKLTLRFLKNESIDNILQLAIACTTLDHREANMSVMKFLVEITKCCRLEQDNPHFNEQQERVQLVNNLLGKYGQEIVKGLINACAGGIQQYMLPEVADAFWEIMSFAHQSTLLWLKDALSNLPTHRPTGAVNATPDQTQRFYKVLSEATSIRVLWKEFRDFSKFYK
jgi:transportin-3